MFIFSYYSQLNTKMAVSYALTHPKDLYSSIGPTLHEATFGALGSLFDPKRDIGDLTGKVIFVTGGSSFVPFPRSLGATYVDTTATSMQN